MYMIVVSTKKKFKQIIREGCYKQKHIDTLTEKAIKTSI